MLQGCQAGEKAFVCYFIDTVSLCITKNLPDSLGLGYIAIIFFSFFILLLLFLNVLAFSFYQTPYKFQTFLSPDEIGLTFLFPVLR